MTDIKANDVNVRNEALQFEPLIKIEQAAKWLGIEPSTLYGWVEKGKFEGVKMGRKSLRVRPEYVRQYITENIQPARGRAA